MNRGEGAVLVNIFLDIEINRVMIGIEGMLERTSLSYFGKFLQEGTPGERVGTLWRLFFASAAQTSPI